jgi:VanZ family protein
MRGRRRRFELAMGQILAVIDRLDPCPGRSQRRGDIAFMLGHVFRALPLANPSRNAALSKSAGM